MKTTTVMLALLLACTSSLYAQDNTTDQEAVDRGIDVLQKAMKGQMGNPDIADQYDFYTSVDIYLTTDDGTNMTSEFNMQILYPKGDDYYAVELKDLHSSTADAPQTIIVFDFDATKVISFMERSGTKMGFTLNLNPDQINNWDSEASTENSSSVVKTGKTKNILGYICEQYMITTAEGKGVCWVSKDAKLDIGSSLSAMSFISKNKDYDMPADFPEGAIMEMDFKHNDGQHLQWLATAINKNIEKNIVSSNYQFMRAQ